MIYQIVAVKDRAADVFGVPVFVQSKGIAIRSFADEINRSDPQNQLYNHPEDFDLFFLGTFDDSDGEWHTVRPQ